MAKAASRKTTKGQRLAKAVADSVGAGKALKVETVDFNDPNRPKTCLEVDFPILPVNQVAAIEGGAGKPIYQVSKWWARRRSTVFRSLLLAAATKAPDGSGEAGKVIWDAYYANHQRKGSFARLSVADIFMGGGTTVVEGSRLGMKMFGNDLNPVAWFIVKSELANIPRQEAQALIDDIERVVRPQIMPFYACPGPHGERGAWTRMSTGEVMPESFDCLAIPPEDRADYSYDGPVLVYTFWAKHGPCGRLQCSHQTPILPSPVIATKELTVKAWAHTCPQCGATFDVEDAEARMAPDAPLVLGTGELPFAVLDPKRGVECPSCAYVAPVSFRKSEQRKKKVALTLLMHPAWLEGAPGFSAEKQQLERAGSIRSTKEWLEARAATVRVVEVRGALPTEVTCPVTRITFSTSTGTVPKKSTFACAACGTVQDVLESIKASGVRPAFAPYAIQGFSPALAKQSPAYNGRFFSAAEDTAILLAASEEWERRKEGDLRDWWPRSEVPFGFMTSMNNGGIANHGLTHWWTMFNARQLLLHAQLLRAIAEVGNHRWEVREAVLAGFEQYLQAQSMMCWWNIQTDRLAVAFSNNSFHPKPAVVEGGFPWAEYGHSRWASCCRKVLDAIDWAKTPTELVPSENMKRVIPGFSAATKSIAVATDDPVRPPSDIRVCSSTDLTHISTGSIDLVITDPPFGGLLHYSELSDFFYVWLRLMLRKTYPDLFSSEYTPKALEAVSNRARNREDAEGQYERLLTSCWSEAFRILKPGGLMAFTFHHSEDKPWVAVLESLFRAGFYLEATWPIRGDETKGEGSKPGSFGSQKIEYDIVHVCRKRTEEPTAVSWAKMRRQVLQDVRSLKHLLEYHQKAGLPEADLQVIRRGKALEYYSRHYGRVLVDDGRSMSVLEALVGINQLLEEESGDIKDPPPVIAEPFTRQFLRLFDGLAEVPRDQIQKFLRGTGIAPSDFEARGWCFESKKTYHLRSPLDIAREWQGKHRRGMTSDYDQASFLIGACFENSGINATDTLSNENFKPHPAVGELLAWLSTRGASSEIRNAASRAQTILRSWRSKYQKQNQQMTFFFDDHGTA